MDKKEFLKALEKELTHSQCEDITSVLEYYDEFIEDKKESGVNENDIIQELSVTDIIRNLKVERKIEEAVKKPSISNGMKALIAFLGVLSFPMLIAFGAVLFALFITIVAVGFSLMIAFGSLFVAAVLSVGAVIVAVITGQIPIPTGLLMLGVMLVLTGLFGITARWTVVGSQKVMKWFSGLIKKKFNKIEARTEREESNDE
ncbi:MAG: DUF1700 domain-containing protein [Oscillospiraceae bacterium]|nr:DUF1700 domain-containing protein [Oscillospiraceae bacterium]